MSITPGQDAMDRIKIGVEAALELAVEDLQIRSVNDAPIDTGELRASADTELEPFGEGRVARARLRFDAEYAATIHEGLAVYQETVVRNVQAYERDDPRLGHLYVRAHENPIGPITIRYTPHTGKTKYVEDNLKAQADNYRRFIALAAKRSVEAGR